MNGMALIEIPYSVDDRPLMEMLEEIAIFENKDLGVLVLERGGTMARYLAENTQPVAAGNGGAITNDNTDQGTLDGGSLTARNLGRNAVRRDLRRVYASPRGIYEQMKAAAAPNGAKGAGAGARAFYKALKSGDTVGAKRIMQAAGIRSASLDVMIWDDGARHRRLRNARGRVNKGNKPQVINDASAMRAYMKRREENVGFTKAAWINAGRQIMARGMGQVRMWIKKHTNSPGLGIDRTKGTKEPHVTLTSRVPWASEALNESQYIRALGQLEESLRKEGLRILAHITRKHERL